MSMMERTHHTLISGGVKNEEQVLAHHKPFWVFFVGNIGLATWLMGILIAGMNVNFTDAMLIIVFGNIVGAALPAVMAILGPKSQLTTVECSRFALGETGKRLPAFLQWLSAVGWDVVANLTAAPALVLLCASFGLTVPLWTVLAFLVGLQMLVGIYGHHAVQNTSVYTGVILGIAFVVMGLLAMNQTHGIPVADAPTKIMDLLSAFILIVTFNIAGWTTWSGDYTRYLPQPPLR